jgi:hypothetical protein
VSGGGDNIAKRKWARMNPSGNQTSKVGNVSHQIGTNFFGDFSKSLEIKLTGIGRMASDNQLRLFLLANFSIVS